MTIIGMDKTVADVIFKLEQAEEILEVLEPYQGYHNQIRDVIKALIKTLEWEVSQL